MQFAFGILEDCAGWKLFAVCKHICTFVNEELHENCEWIKEKHVAKHSVEHWRLESLIKLSFLIRQDELRSDRLESRGQCCIFAISFASLCPSFLPSFFASFLPSFHTFSYPAALSLSGTSCRLYPNTAPLFRAGQALCLTTPWT